MTPRTIFLLILILFSIHKPLHAQDTTFTESPLLLETPTGKLYGTLSIPIGFKKGPVALIIAGSGPTDRDGNSGIAGKNESLKKLSAGLCKQGIATVRYDKRGIGESKGALKSEADFTFNDMVKDAQGWVDLILKDKRFTQLTIVGHSEGSLIGMIVAKEHVAKFVSVAGTGQSADKILKIQFRSLPQPSKDVIYPMLDSIKAGYTLKKVDPSLNMLFRPSVQPYLISWFKYDPAEEIARLKIPVMIVQGKNDIQVSVEDAQMLYKAKPDATLLLVEKMNHVLKLVDSADKQVNIDTYNKPELPDAPELIEAVGKFILKP